MLESYRGENSHSRPAHLTSFKNRMYSSSSLSALSGNNVQKVIKTENNDHGRGGVSGVGYAEENKENMRTEGNRESNHHALLNSKVFRVVQELEVWQNSRRGNYISTEEALARCEEARAALCKNEEPIFFEETPNKNSAMAESELSARLIKHLQTISGHLAQLISMKKYFIEPRQFSSLLSLQTVLAENDRLNQKSPYSGVTVSGFAADSGRSLRSKLNSQLHIDMSEGSATKDALYRRLNDKKRDIVDHIVKIEARIQDLE